LSSEQSKVLSKAKKAEGKSVDEEDGACSFLLSLSAFFQAAFELGIDSIEEDSNRRDRKGQDKEEATILLFIS
jgi:hypothetical protein